MASVLKFVSDLHLERLTGLVVNQSCLKSIWKFDRKPNHLYYLALVGDIGNCTSPSSRKCLVDFFDLISPKYNQIFYVMGNHEYYSLGTPKYSMTEIKNMTQDICAKYHNINLLDNSSVEIDGIKFIGSTLWSKISNGKKEYLAKSINDYHRIHTEENKVITPDQTNVLNKINVDWLETEINTQIPCVVMTHHAPLFNNVSARQFTSDPKYTHSLNNEAFHNDLGHLIKKPVVAWLYGHTHYASEFTFGNVLVATNQLGYSFEQKKIKFDPNREINLTDLLVNEI
jgi:hypothetical protein